jgi:hypothetical protein
MGPSLRIGIPSGLPTIRELGISVENFQGPYRGRDAGGTRLFARYFGSWCVCTFQFDTISVQWFDFRSMNSVQVPGAVVLPLMTSGTSVLSCVVTFAPAPDGRPAVQSFPVVGAGAPEIASMLTCRSRIRGRRCPRPARIGSADSPALTDALIADLAQIAALRVISRTSAMRFKGIHPPLSELARDLCVADGVVEGSALRVGDASTAIPKKVTRTTKSIPGLPKTENHLSFPLLIVVWPPSDCLARVKHRDSCPQSTIERWCHAGLAFERISKVALVGEPNVSGNLS